MRVSQELPIDAMIRPTYVNRDRVSSDFKLNFTKMQELNIDTQLGSMVPRITFDGIRKNTGNQQGLYNQHDLESKEGYIRDNYVDGLPPYQQVYDYAP